MKGERHSPGQIIVKPREADALLSTGATLGQACQKLAVSGPTFHHWRNQYGGMKGKTAETLQRSQMAFASGTGLESAPVAEQDGQIRRPDAAVTVQIGWAVIAVDAGPPIAQQNGQVKRADCTVADTNLSPALLCPNAHGLPNLASKYTELP